MSQIKFVQLSQAKYDEFALITDTTSVNYVSSNKIYFTTDTNRIYKGKELYTGFEVLQSLPENASAVGKHTDRLYVIATTGDMYIKATADAATLTPVGGNSAAMETMRQGISSNADAIASNYSVISSVSNDIYKTSGIAERLTAAENEIDALSAIGDVSQFVGLVAGKMNTSDFNTYSSATSATLATLESDINTNAGNISSNAAEIAGVKTSIANLTSSSAVTVEVAETATTGYLKTYVIKQGGVAADVKIDIPKDLVVSSGSVVKGTWAQGVFTEGVNGAGTALKLVIANHEDQPVYINTLDLVKDHTGSTVDGITVSISNTNEISVSIADGTISSSTLAADVQTSLGKADTALQSGATYYTDIKVDENGSTLAVDMSAVKGRIDDLEAFQSSSSADVDAQIDAKIAELDVADEAVAGKYVSAVSEADGKITVTRADLPTYTLSSGSANGTVSFNGVDVAVTGLGSAAFTDATAYDAAGAADAVLGEASDAATENTVYGAKAAVVAAKNEVVGTSSDAAGTLTLNGLSSSIAILNSTGTGSVANQVALASSQAVTEANSYTDEALAWEVIEDEVVTD